MQLDLRKLATLLMLAVQITGCNSDSDTRSSNNYKVGLIQPWQQHEAFREINSTAYISKVVGDELVIQEPYAFSKIDMDNNAAHYTRFRFDDSNVYAGAIGSTHFASTVNSYQGIVTISAADPNDELEYFYTYLDFLQGESWLANVPYSGIVVPPSFYFDHGPTSFGVFNDNDDLATIVYTHDNLTCHAVIVAFRQKDASAYKELYFKSVTEMANPCYDGGDAAIYTTDGSNFFLGTINNGAYRLSPDGVLTKIYDDRVTKLFYRHNGTLILQSDNKILISNNIGDTWTTVAEYYPLSSIEFFEVSGELYFYYLNQIYHITIGENSLTVTELDNTGLEDIVSFITSATEFNGKVYVTTMGSGVYFRNVEDFILTKATTM